MVSKRNSASKRFRVSLRTDDFDVVGSRFLDRVLPIPFFLVVASLALAAARPSVVVLAGSLLLLSNILLTLVFTHATRRNHRRLRRAVFILRAPLIAVLNAVFIIAVGHDTPGWLIAAPAVAAMPFPYESYERLLLIVLTIGAACAAYAWVGADLGSLLIAASTLACIGWIAVATVSAMRRAMDEARIAEERALQAEHLAHVGRIAAQLAHEVNNPLAYIIANVEHLARRHEEIAQAHNIAPAVRRELDAIVNDALDGAVRVADSIQELRQMAPEKMGDTAEFKVELPPV